MFAGRGARVQSRSLSVQSFPRDLRKEGNLYLPGSNISLAFPFSFKISTLSPNFEFVNYLLYISVSCSLVSDSLQRHGL